MRLGKNNRKLTSKINAKSIKEINFNSKLHNGNLKELSNIFRDRLCRLYEIELMMFYVNPFSTLGLTFVAKDVSTIYEANVARPELKLLANLTLKIISGNCYTTQLQLLKILQSRLNSILGQPISVNQGCR